MKNVKVRNMISDNGNAVANQFIINVGDMTYFQSYRSVIAERNETTGRVRLDEATWNYSKTTSKYRNIFLDEDTAITKSKIKSGVYELANLNEK